MVLPRCGWIASARHMVRGWPGAPLSAAPTALMLLLGGATLTGCVTLSNAPSTNTPPLTTGQEVRFTEVNADRFRPWSDAAPAYRVNPGDRLKIKYFITRDMDEELTVSPDGTIAPRAIGQMRVEGATLGGIEEQIRRASRKELVDQKVVVSLEAAAGPRIYIGGMVTQPGMIKLESSGTSVLQALMMAGGLNSEARTGQVALIRRGPDNLPMLKLIDVRQIIETGFSEDDVPLMSGDIIFVPRSSIAEIDLWIDQFINRVVPFQRTFSYTLGSYTQYGGGSTTVLP